jgi:hypothetical protein
MRKKIYFGHSREFDFINELYQPIRNSHLNDKYEIIFPHENRDEPFNSKDQMFACDLMIAEVSYPATGLGVELGWADIYDVPIICVYKKGFHPPRSTQVITDKFLEYSDSKELVSGLEEMISKI